MDIRFDDAPMGKELSGYELWARDLDDPGRVDNRRTEFLQPAVVRLLGGQDALIDALVRVDQAVKDGFLLMDGWDAERLERDIAGDPKRKEALEAAREEETLLDLYWREADEPRVRKEFAEVFEIVSLGRRIVAPVKLSRILRPRRDPLPPEMADKPLVAVIDDGIGFLNARFRRKVAASGGGMADRTRFHAVWLQAYNTVPLPPFYTLKGRVLYRAEIDAILADAARLDEGGTYRTLGAPLLEPGAHRSLEFGFSHGTHIADVAAGADPAAGDPVSDWPMIAIQLPPQAVNNTAGQQLERFIIRGVDFVLGEARALGGGAPVVINVSFATFAGPKDGTKRIEARIARLLAAFEAATGRCARVVYAFGNGWRGQQLARFRVGCGETAVDLRVQPDNRASTLVEVRPDDPADMARLALDITLPDGTALPFLPLPPGTARSFIGPAGVIARLFHVAPTLTAPGVTTPAHFLLAIAPTADRSGPRAPAGAWGLALGSLDGTTFPARIEVQRGDTPLGYPVHGRQAYLDHPDAYEWEAELAAFSQPAPHCPITRQGTHSSFVTARSPATISVGAIERRVQADALVPSRYSAEGAPWSVPRPDLSAVADMGPALLGVVASGTSSGSARRLDGTSVAAAQATRTIASDMAGAGCTPLVTAAQVQAAIDALVTAHGVAALPPETGRKGAGVLVVPDGGRPRREG